MDNLKRRKCHLFARKSASREPKREKRKKAKKKGKGEEGKKGRGKEGRGRKEGEKIIFFLIFLSFFWAFEICELSNYFF